jgi:hypothetical protein
VSILKDSSKKKSDDVQPKSLISKVDLNVIKKLESEVAKINVAPQEESGYDSDQG